MQGRQLAAVPGTGKAAALKPTAFPLSLGNAVKEGSRPHEDAGCGEGGNNTGDHDQDRLESRGMRNGFHAFHECRKAIERSFQVGGVMHGAAVCCGGERSPLYARLGQSIRLNLDTRGRRAIEFAHLVGLNDIRIICR